MRLPLPPIGIQAIASLFVGQLGCSVGRRVDHTLVQPLAYKVNQLFPVHGFDECEFARGAALLALDAVARQNRNFLIGTHSGAVPASFLRGLSNGFLLSDQRFLCNAQRLYSVSGRSRGPSSAPCSPACSMTIRLIPVYLMNTAGAGIGS